MKNFVLSLDLEEWYHLEYFKNISPDLKDDVFIFKMNEFFDFLEKNQIKITVFVVAELALKYPKIVQEIFKRGHEIGCHGFNHTLDYNKTNEEFYNEIKKSKTILEDVISSKIYGYRAPCFSLTDEKLDILSELNFIYDSSFINFENHSLYNKLDLKNFRVKDDLIYENKKIIEVELPTINLSNSFKIPISGGAYFRFFPMVLNKFLIDKFLKKNNNFIFYIHPFELNSYSVNTKELSFLNRLRFNYKRNYNLNRLKSLITYLMINKVSFKRIIDII